MHSVTHSLMLASVNILLPIACILFASGFFPYKPSLPGLAQYQHLEYNGPPAAPFDKIIFMVVDALRRNAAKRISVEFD